MNAASGAIRQNFKEYRLIKDRVVNGEIKNMRGFQILCLLFPILSFAVFNLGMDIKLVLNKLRSIPKRGLFDFLDIDLLHHPAVCDSEQGGLKEAECGV